jgi:hypothetical protein
VRKILLFLKKKKQKGSYSWPSLKGFSACISNWLRERRFVTLHRDKSLFASFSSEKEESLIFL